MNKTIEVVHEYFSYNGKVLDEIIKEK